jgi:pyruvate kinase
MNESRAKIVCTIGPVSSNRAVLFHLINSGMDVARLNFPHGSHESHREVIRLIRAGSKKVRRPVSILQDL